MATDYSTSNSHFAKGNCDMGQRSELTHACSEDDANQAGEVNYVKPKSRDANLNITLIQDCDYLRITYTDIHGIPRAQTIPARHIRRIIDKGICSYTGVLFLGPQSQVSDSLRAVHDEMRDNDSCRMQVVPDMSSFHHLPWASNAECKIGEIYCDLKTKFGLPLAIDPRDIARQEIKALENLGLRILSACELEFVLEEKNAQKPIFEGSKVFGTLVMAELWPFFSEIERSMYRMGIDIEMFHPEFAPGQFEIKPIPVFGLDGADKLQILKQGIREVAQRHGLQASFMSKPYLGVSGNGKHFNFSLWDKEDRNVFYDKSGTDGISETARHWLAGILKHACGLTALLCPTVNCYRRLQGRWSPRIISWGIESRNALVRVKTGDERDTFMELRIPSGHANPYLMMAAVIAAGLDGMKCKTELPPEGTEGAPTCPAFLGEALSSLERDTELVSALGQEFVRMFCSIKRDIELEQLFGSEPPRQNLSDLNNERKMYFDM